MVLFEKYYTVIGRDPEDVPYFWKGTHIVTYVCIFISSSITSYCFGSVLSVFGNNCILNPNLRFLDEDLKIDNTTYEGILQIDFTNSEWGSRKLCDYCLFTKIISAILAFILGAFFSVNPRGGRENASYGLSPPWQIVFPSLIVNGIVSILILVTAVQLNSGIKSFCAEFDTVFNMTECSEKLNIYTLEFDEKIQPLHLFLTITNYSNYICVIAWAFQFMLLLTRFLFGIDFMINIVKIKDLNEKPSGIQRNIRKSITINEALL